MPKPLSKEQMIRNHLNSELSGFLNEFESTQPNREDVLRFFSVILCAAKVDSRITVDVLEKFGEDGKEQAMCIKVTEGW